MKRFLLLLLPLFCAARALGASPNIVYLISDDQAWTDYGFMGHPQIQTPHLDKLAARSAVFRRGYVPTALCRPALATFATGLYAFQHRISGNDPAQHPDPKQYRDLREALISHIDEHPTLPKLLGEKGYLSHQSGKWWEGNYTRGGFTHGMTRGFPQPGGRHGDDGLKIGRQGLQPVFDFIELSLKEEKPFMLWYAPFMPHTPHTPPERLFKKYKDMGVASDHVARYYAMVEWFDETCGELLGYLDKKGLTDNTVVVYVADNGWIQQENAGKYAPRSKQSANEGGVRQPILFSWPGVIQAGDRGDQLCSSVDIFPTLLSAAGARIPDGLPGFDLMPALRDGKPSPRQRCFGDSYSHDVTDVNNPEASLLYRWVVEGPWKLLLTYDGKLGRYASSHPREEKRPQLYNLLDDPHENNNLASDHPEVVSRLSKALNDLWPVTHRQVITEWSSSPGEWKQP